MQGTKKGEVVMGKISESRKIKFPEAIGLLVAFVAILMWGALSAGIPTGISICLCSFTAALYGIIVLHKSWNEIQTGILKVIGIGMPATLILLMVGLISGSWLSSGTTPILIYWGLKILNPSIYLAVTFLITAIGGMATGSAWAIMATFGVALMGVANGLGIPAPAAAAAICCGSYLGDKWSPLSDVTNLASAVTEENSFRLFGCMIPTSGVSAGIALVIYAVMGFVMGTHGTFDASQTKEIISTLEDTYTFNPILILPLIVVVVLAVMKKPIFPVLVIGAGIGTVFSILIQGTSVTDALSALYNGYTVTTGNEAIDGLLSGGGLSYMMSLILMLFCAFVFAGIMESMGLLDAILEKLIKVAKSRGNLILISMITTVLGVYMTSSVYVSTIMNGRMYLPAYEKEGIDKIALARTLTECASNFGAIVPWSNGAIIMLSTFGVAWYQYAPYMFNHWLAMILVLICGYTGKFLPLSKKQDIESHDIYNTDTGGK